MTDGGVLAKWKDYRVYFGVKDTDTAKRRLAAAGIRCPKYGPPLMRKETLDRKIDNKLQK